MTKARAAVFGRYPSFSTAVSTRMRVSGRTGPVSLMTRETVMWETPAIAATSARLGCRGVVLLDGPGIGTSSSRPAE